MRWIKSIVLHARRDVRRVTEARSARKGEVFCHCEAYYAVAISSFVFPYVIPNLFRNLIFFLPLPPIWYNISKLTKK